MGVFATRSPFRPNPIGLSCVRLERIEQHPQGGPVLWVAGADLMDGTPIYDVKPYLPYADCRPEAAGGFASQPKEASLRVECPPELLGPVEEERRAALLGVLAQDPRPTYQHLSLIHIFPAQRVQCRRSVSGGREDRGRIPAQAEGTAGGQPDSGRTASGGAAAGRGGCRRDRRRARRGAGL